MKRSRYSKTYPVPGDPSSVILFSTRRASAVQVPRGLLDDIEAGRLSPEERAGLAGLGLLVPGGADEGQDMLSCLRDLNALDRALQFIVVLNLDCNLACRYCFEGVRKGQLYLSDDTTDRFLAFVRGLDTAGKDEVRVTFYGGEPLLSQHRIAGISRQLRSFAEERGLRYRFSLVTNGVLLTPQAVRRMLPLGLASAKVTLDGPPAEHDYFRPFRSGAGSFDVILRNIVEAAGDIAVQVGGNFTRFNYREFPALLDLLRERGLGPDRVAAVKFDPVVNESRAFALPDFRDGCVSMDEPWVAEASVWLREEVLRRGYSTPKVMPAPCLLERDHSFVLDHDGVLYKCPGMIGRQACAVGDVWSGVRDHRASQGLDDWQNDECLACAYLPLCFGGCKYLNLVNDGSLRGVQCRKAYYDRVLAAQVFQDIRYGL